MTDTNERAAHPLATYEAAIEWLYGLPRHFDIYIHRTNRTGEESGRNIHGEKSGRYDDWQVSIQEPMIAPSGVAAGARPLGSGSDDNLLEAIRMSYDAYIEQVKNENG